MTRQTMNTTRRRFTASTDNETARKIREERAATGMSYEKLGEKFGVAMMVAWYIGRGYTYRDAGGPVDPGSRPHGKERRTALRPPLAAGPDPVARETERRKEAAKAREARIHRHQEGAHQSPAGKPAGTARNGTA